jgi:RNA polymerase sigma-70 factor (ECF subfamily)
MVVLRHYENLSELEVAGILECPVGTVKSTTSRALASIRAAIGGARPRSSDRRPRLAPEAGTR